MKKESPLLSRREFVGALAAAMVLPALGPAPIRADPASVQQPPPARPYDPPYGRTLEQERREAVENIEKAVKPIREFAVPVGTEPAFIFRARFKGR
ncbi:MAG: hypothetical protein ACE5H2_06000 [Terriglobia bacterium]